METKLDTLSTALVQVQQMIMQKGLDPMTGSVPPNPGKKDDIVVAAGESETTIYKNAVEQISCIGNDVNIPKSDASKLDPKRQSSSSDEGQVDTSDEIINLDQTLPNQIISGCEGGADSHEANPEDVMCNSGQWNGVHHQMALELQPGPSRGDEMIRDTANVRVSMSAVKGGLLNQQNFLHSAIVDEEYLVIGSHVDEQTCKKIINFEYVDFSKLLPRDRVSHDDEQRMELVNRNGLTYWSPMADYEQTAITSFAKWEAAFHVFSNIFTVQYPNKAAELIQYNHVIHTASMTYLWENVYLYDKEFRIHMSKYIQSSWAVILQQAWNLRLKDKITHPSFQDKFKNGNEKKEICKCFNRGKCHSGWSCRYEHKCLECCKFGHGAHICRQKAENLKSVAVTDQTGGSEQQVQRDERRGGNSAPHN